MWTQFMQMRWNVLAAVESVGEQAPGDVPGWLTALFAVLLAVMIAALAFEEKLHARKSIIVGAFAGGLLILETLMAAWLDRPIVPFGAVTLPDGHAIELPVYIPAIDWSVITIILGASLFVEVISRSGVFSWLAIRLTKQSGGDPWRLLLVYGLLTVLFSAVLNNVTAMIIVGSLTAVSLSKLQRTDLLLGFLLVEGLLTNVGGLLTLISSVPNIIVGRIAGISFVRFFLVAAPYVLISSTATLFLGKWLFGIRPLATDEARDEARRLVESFDEREGVPSARFFTFAVALLVLFIATLSVQSVLPFNLDRLGMGFVALFFAGVALLVYRHEVDRFYRAVDWDLLAFFAGLFVVINVMEHAQVLAAMGRGIAAVLAMEEHAASAVLLSSSAIASSVTDNIPLAAMLAKILAADPQVLATEPDPSASPFWWCVVFGANLGGNITPIGSASTVVAMTIIHRHELKLTFPGFVIKALPFALMQIVLAIGYVLVVL